MARVKINSSYSAQPSIVRPNPLFSKVIDHIINNDIFGNNLSKLKVADQGCGKLRHLKPLLRYFNSIYLIDTVFQLNRLQRLFGKNQTSINDYIGSLKTNNEELKVISNIDFNSSRYNLDIVFNICVFDVELPSTRVSMAKAALRNLKRNGLYVIIAPRNDQSILVRCKSENRYSDGHIFQHHGVTTFFKNFRDTKRLVYSLTRFGYEVVKDLSIYRHVCLIFKKRK